MPVTLFGCSTKNVQNVPRNLGITQQGHVLRTFATLEEKENI